MLSFPTGSVVPGLPPSNTATTLASFPSTSNSSPSAAFSPENTLPTSSASTPLGSGDPSSTGTSQSSPTDSAQADNSNGLSGGAIAGVVLGTLAAFSMLVLLLLCLIYRGRRRKSGSAFTMLRADGRQDETHGAQSRRTSARQADITNLVEAEALMDTEYGRDRLSMEEERLAALPPIMLQSPDSGDSVRHCPSNNSLTTISAISAVNTDSTKTRASLISQFPVYDRKPSDRSSDGGHEGGSGAGGPAAGPSGSRPAEPRQGENSGSGKTTSDRNLFSAPPPRPPSRTRSVPANVLPASIGLGRPSFSSRGPRSPRLASLPETASRANVSQHPGPLAQSTSSTRLERNVSHRSSRSLLDAPVWLKGFTWLQPFFERDAPVGQLDTYDLEKGSLQDTSDSVSTSGQEQSGRLLPTAAPVMRETPGYRRVTTTAAAYDIQDLRDLSERTTGQQTTSGVSDDESEDGYEGRSFLESPVVRTPPVSATRPPQGTSRWSRATLGQ